MKSIKGFHELSKERFDINVDIVTYKTDNTYYWTRRTIPAIYQHNVDTKKEQIDDVEALLLSGMIFEETPKTNLDSL